ncbi:MULTISPECIES: response regulator transcription factor [Flavobacterium]|jgi:two-component system copper resistance phosphate regulon response regulator CusR|uniref:Two component transcriptional regulator, winged helix family n=1 Tax=Flavobacterium johnsoniae (strain ATCC 17061 / DSM 2064 / JCM 8514 / BCRC 14874 / CCUG 350202 / NBRC 14942 / NCIMB 11054 / UW101) TaxID=376686 RepID=A5FCZ9_FLAJ1|nr:MULTISPECIES: response regulator transcription factor [Flavobacterium]ABQ06928.1 two component transcriptional regulator, winged helix family [Flavobacterium johnsoniae UW101]OXE97214.1 DNA-binding response regulator [Flavobacterium johnsoniae UW101]WDF57646.1 response regulator transcription factor [Flavobacterium sp. KACC 22758]WQG81239.1 response regulator transcription factor [Flavobacterium johnsoniae UW101]SHL36283.1 two component transcriptional regulator, winged helix family [Flavob
MNKVLLVEDDPRVASFILRGLEENLYQVKTVSKGYEAVNEVMENDFDIIILDIMLPDITGFEVCEILRNRKIIVPILILSALDTPHEKVKGLQSGADDYLAKPFLFEELLARINAQLRRAEFSSGILDFQSYAGIEINMKEQSASRDGKELNLSSRELKLLIFFMKNREKALSRIAIAEAVWNLELDMNSNTVDVYINYLRNKVDKNFSEPLIHTVKGTGYMLKKKTHES